MNNKKTALLSLTIPRELLEKIREMAKEDGRSLSNMVAWILTQWVRKGE